MIMYFAIIGNDYEKDGAINDIFPARRSDKLFSALSEMDEELSKNVTVYLLNGLESEFFSNKTKVVAERLCDSLDFNWDEGKATEWDVATRDFPAFVKVHANDYMFSRFVDEWRDEYGA